MLNNWLDRDLNFRDAVGGEEGKDALKKHIEPTFEPGNPSSIVSP